MNLDSLKERREKKDGPKIKKKTLRHEAFYYVFPLNTNNHLMRKRNTQKYIVNNCKTERYGRSAVLFLQRLLNEDYRKQKKDIKSLLQVNSEIVIFSIISPSLRKIYTIIIIINIHEPEY